MSGHRKSSIGGLVMTRKPGEKVLVNHGEIVIEVVEIFGQYVRLAFYADREIHLIRAEAEPDLASASVAEDKKRL